MPISLLWPGITDWLSLLRTAILSGSRGRSQSGFYDARLTDIFAELVAGMDSKNPPSGYEPEELLYDIFL